MEYRKSIAILFTNLSMAAPLMLNFYTVLVLLYRFFNIWILPDYKTYQTEIFLVIVGLGLIYIFLHHRFLVNHLDKIIDEFKDENKKSAAINGWIVALYVIGSFAGFWILAFATIGR